jgi:hypothetical protein
MSNDRAPSDPNSPRRQRAEGLAIALFGLLILCGFVAARIGLDGDPPRDWPARIVCEILVGLFGVSGVTILVAGVSYVVTDAATVDRWTSPLLTKALLWGAAFVVASFAAIAIYSIWPAVAR